MREFEKILGNSRDFGGNSREFGGSWKEWGVILGEFGRILGEFRRFWGTLGIWGYSEDFRRNLDESERFWGISGKIKFGKEFGGKFKSVFAWILRLFLLFLLYPQKNKASQQAFNFPIRIPNFPSFPLAKLNFLKYYFKINKNKLTLYYSFPTLTSNRKQNISCFSPFSSFLSQCLIISSSRPVFLEAMSFFRTLLLLMRNSLPEKTKKTC